MAILKKRPWIKYIIAIPFLGVFLCLFLFIFLIYGPSWPSKAQLCRDVENYIPKDKCLGLSSQGAILERAFPEGEMTTENVKSALAEYLVEEHPTSYGYIQYYHLCSSPLDYLTQTYQTYIFRYDEDGILVAFDYES